MLDRIIICRGPLCSNSSYAEPVFVDRNKIGDFWGGALLDDMTYVDHEFYTIKI